MLIRMLLISMALAAQGDVSAIVREARAEAVRGKTDRARALLSSVVEGFEKDGKTDSDDYVNALLRLSEVSTNTAEVLDKALVAAGDRRIGTEVAIRRGFTHVRAKQFGEAIPLFAKAARLDPKQAPRAAMWMAITHAQSGDRQYAELSVGNALREVETGGVAEAEISMIAATVYESLGRAELANTLRQRAAELWKGKQQPITPGAVRVGGGVTAPSIIQRFEPRYSQEASAAKHMGSIVLYLVVGENGVPRDIRVLRGLGMGLEELAVESVAEWRFKPGMKDGQPVPVAATIEVNFRLL